MRAVSLRSVIKIRIGNPYIHIPKDIATKIKAGWKKPLPVLIQVNGKPDKPWQINMIPIGNGDFYLYLHGDVREASKTKVGDKVLVTIEFDEKYKNGPMHPIPDWFKKELDIDKRAKENWDKLIPSRQKEILRYFSWLKSDQAKERNLKKVMSALSGQKSRFMARDWN